MRTLLLLVLAAASALACDPADPAVDGGSYAGTPDTGPGPLPDAGPVEEVSWPAMGSPAAASDVDGFRFGAASAATQLEDMNPDVDRYVWPRIPP